MSNYTIALNWLLTNNKIVTERGHAYRIDVNHDATCGVFNTQSKEHPADRCNCQPDFKIDGQPVDYPKSILGA
jgi:hypothetical protein